MPEQNFAQIPTQTPDTPTHNFWGRHKVYPFSNEVMITTAAEALKRLPRKTPYSTFAGIIGGVDTFLTYAVTTDAEKWLAFDINPYAIYHLQYRLARTLIHDNPIDYINGLLFPKFESKTQDGRPDIQRINPSTDLKENTFKDAAEKIVNYSPYPITSVHAMQLVLYGESITSDIALGPQGKNTPYANMTKMIRDAFYSQFPWLSIENPT